MAPKIPNPKVILTGAESGFLAKATKEGNVKVSKLFEDAPPHIKSAIWQHEVGHISLGHHKIDRKAFNASQRLQLELKADRFAAKAGSDIKAALQFAIESNASPHGRRVLQQRLTALQDTPRYIQIAKAAEGFGQHKFEAVLPKLKNFASRKNALLAGAIAGSIAGVALLASAITSPDSKDKFDPTNVPGILPSPGSWADFLYGNKEKSKKADEERALSPGLEYNIFSDYKMSDVEYRKYLERLKNSQKEESGDTTLKTEEAREVLNEMTWREKFSSEQEPYSSSGNKFTPNTLLSPNQTTVDLANTYNLADQMQNPSSSGGLLGIASLAQTEPTVPQDREIDVLGLAFKAPAPDPVQILARQTEERQSKSPYVSWAANKMPVRKDSQNVQNSSDRLQGTIKEHIRWSGDKEKDGKEFIAPLAFIQKSKKDKLVDDVTIRRDVNRDKDRQDRINDKDFSIMFGEEGLHPGFSQILKDQSTSGTWNLKAHSEFGSGYRGNPDMEFEKQIAKRFDESMVGEASEEKRTKQLRSQFKWYAAALEKFGQASGTGHKRILMSKNVFEEEEIEKLGFMRVSIAIPEAGQTTFSSFRDPDSLYHIHEFEKNWTMHRDEHHSSTMMFERMKRRRKKEDEETAKKHAAGLPATEQDVFDKIGAKIEDAWENISTFASGLPHVFTEGLPGAYYYSRGKVTGVKSMSTRLKEEIDPRFFELQSMVEDKLEETNTAYNEIEALHPGSEGIGAETLREHSEFGSGYQGPNEKIQEYIGAPTKILAGTALGTALAWNMGKKRLAGAIGLVGAAAGLSGMVAGREMLEGVEESALPTLVGSAGAVASGAALTAAALSKSRTYEETLIKGLGHKGGQLFKKAPYALWMAGGAADVITAGSTKEGIWEAGEFGASFAGWKIGASLYEKHAKKTIENKFLSRFKHKGLPGVALHLAGLAGSKFLAAGYNSSFNRPVSPIEGLHPDSEGMGTQMIRDTSDFGSIIKALFNRGSVKKAVANTAENISAPAKKLIASMKTGGSQDEILERAYQSIGARRMTDSLEFVQEMRGKKVLSNIDEQFMEGKISIEQFTGMEKVNIQLKREAEQVAAQGFTSAPSRGLVFVGKTRADASAQMMSEFHELLEVGYHKTIDKGSPVFGTHLARGIIEDEALLRMYAGKDVFEAGRTFRMLEGGTKHGISEARRSWKKTETALTKLRKSRKATKEIIDAKEHAAGFMKYKLETLEIYKGTPERYKRLGNLIEGIHPQADDTIGAQVIRDTSDFGSGYKSIYGLLPKKVSSQINRNVREEVVMGAVGKAVEPKHSQKEVVKHVPDKTLNDTQLAVRRNKKFREVSTAAVGAGLRAAHNAGRGHRNFSSTMPA